MTVGERHLLLEEEVLILHNSGEIPEIALHGSLYYLTQDEEGPGLDLDEEELGLLHDAAEHRYREIVLRDLDPANRDLRIYRGIARTVANWRRYREFCRRIGRDCQDFKPTVRRKIQTFLHREYADVRGGERESCVNCSADELIVFFREMDIDQSDLPGRWQALCPC